jgi:hypothetical protein
MGMSTHVYAIVPPDEQWEAMKAVWDACKLAKVDPPEAVERFFNNEEPDPAGLVVNVGAMARKWTGDCAEGVEVTIRDLERLHPGVKAVRFVNSW